mmetsp:Transcript_85423/g.150815  ORF Transcript_85423/g.150815 Transcript_85423/m.150815 type:complete len:503 (-) Transcript_85423:12-1520(-)
MRCLLSLDLRVLFLMGLAKCSHAVSQAKKSSQIWLSVDSMASTARENVSSPATEGSNAASPPEEDVPKYYKSHDGCASEAEVKDEALCKKVAGSLWNPLKIKPESRANHPKGCYWDPYAQPKGAIKFNELPEGEEGKFPEGKDYQAICLGEFTYWYYWPICLGELKLVDFEAICTGEVDKPVDFKPREVDRMDAAELNGETIEPYSLVRVIQKEEKDGALYLKLAGKQGGWCFYDYKDPGSRFLEVPKCYKRPLVEKDLKLYYIKPCKALTAEQCEMIAAQQGQKFYHIAQAENEYLLDYGYPKGCSVQIQRLSFGERDPIFWPVIFNDEEGKPNEDSRAICLEYEPSRNSTDGLDSIRDFLMTGPSERSRLPVKWKILLEQDGYGYYTKYWDESWLQFGRDEVSWGQRPEQLQKIGTWNATREPSPKRMRYDSGVVIVTIIKDPSITRYLGNPIIDKSGPLTVVVKNIMKWDEQDGSIYPSLEVQSEAYPERPLRLHYFKM